MPVSSRCLTCVLILAVPSGLAGGPAAENRDAGQPASKQPLAEQLPRIKPVEPAAALNTFTVQKGFRLELVAAEPMVADPVDACFDAAGRMYVAEMHGYPFSQEPTRLNPTGGGKKDAGIIRLLEDTNGDGRFDRSVKFATGIRWPTSVCAYDGGVFALAPPHIWYFKDTSGDGKADVRKIVFTGFGRDNVQSVANNMKWGLDNRIYLAGGRNPGVLKRGPGSAAWIRPAKTSGQPSAVINQPKNLAIRLGRVDVSFDPGTLDVRPETGGVQFGHCFDDWGRRFVCSNSNHIQHVVFSYQDTRRNPNYAVPGTIRSIAREGAAAPVFRRSRAEPWRIVRTRRRASDPNFRKRLPKTELVPIGFFTSATGVTVYRGDAYPPEFHGNVFIGDVGGNLVHRKRLNPNGVSFLAERADQGVEFITSTDNWFRPVNFVNGPDGCLYILDMYRETIEHPHSIPADIKSHLFLESGDNRGRIYRLTPPRWRRRPITGLGEPTLRQLVQKLNSANGWTRETAQRLLWERRAAAVQKTLMEVAGSKRPQSRVHALWTLAGLNLLDDQTLRRWIEDTDPRVREQALQLAARRRKLPVRLDAVTAEPSPRAAFQLALMLGDLDGENIEKAWADLARRRGGNRDISAALMTSAAGKADRLAIALLKDPDRATGLLVELARIVAAGKDRRPAFELLAAATSRDTPLPIRHLVVRSLGDGLDRRGSSLTKLLATYVDGQVHQQVRTMFRRAAQAANDPKQPIADRRRAIELLACADEAIGAKQLPGLLTPAVPQSLQLAAVQSLSKHSGSGVSELLLDGWRGYSPKVRREVVDVMLSRAARVNALLEAIASSRIQRGEIERDKKQLLMNHPNARIRRYSRKLFAGEVSPNRAKVVAAYQKALDLQPDTARGLATFKKRCATCHRVGGQGYNIGPDLASVRNKSERDLIISILDPNREAQPNFTVYTLITRRGRIVTGVIAAETATSVTLRRAEGKQDVVLRNDIDRLVSTGKSMMPEGLEKDLTPQQLADVIALIKSIRPDSKPKP